MFGIKGVRTLGALIYMASLGIYLFIRRREYDIVHVHQALYPAFISVLVGKGILGKPVIVKTASSGKTSDIEQLKRFPFGTLQLKYLLKKMDCLVTVSQAGGKDYTEIGFPESRVINIPNGVSIPTEGKATYDPAMSVLTIARLSQEKGIDVLLEAWANIKRQVKTFRLLIVGEGPLELKLKRLSRSLGVDETVIFAGGVNNVGEYLREADLFILPSKTEGLSNALLEAMSYGIPCIATPAGGNLELLGMENPNEIPPGGYGIGRNGLLVNSSDVKGLSDAMLYLIQDEKARETFGRKGRTYIDEKFNIDLVSEKYIALYKNLMENRSKEAMNR